MSHTPKSTSQGEGINQTGADNNNSQKEISTMLTENNNNIVSTDNLDLGVAQIEVTKYESGTFRFGAADAPSVARRENHEEAFGFLNALGGIKTDLYKVLEPGYHSKYTEQQLADMYDMPIRRMFVSYVKWIEATPERIAWLDANGVHPFVDKDQPNVDFSKWWQGIVVEDGRMRVLRPCIPMKQDSLKARLEAWKAKGTVENPREYHWPECVRNLEWDWQIHSKHEGLKLAMALLAGKMRVYITPFSDKPGFEYLADIRQGRFEELFNNKEHVKAVLYAGMVEASDNNRASRKAGILRNNPKNLQTATDKMAAQGVTVWLNEQEQVVKPSFLHGKTVQFRQGENVTGFRYLRDDADVSLANDKAQMMNGILQVVLR